MDCDRLVFLPRKENDRQPSVLKTNPCLVCADVAVSWLTRVGSRYVIIFVVVYIIHVCSHLPVVAV